MVRFCPHDSCPSSWHLKNLLFWWIPCKNIEFFNLCLARNPPVYHQRLVRECLGTHRRVGDSFFRRRNSETPRVMEKVRGMGVVDENDEAGLHGTRGSLLDLGVAMMEVKRPDHDQDRVLWTPPPFTITAGSNPHLLILFTTVIFRSIFCTILVYQFVFLTVLIKQKTQKKKKKREAWLMWSMPNYCGPQLWERRIKK